MPHLSAPRYALGETFHQVAALAELSAEARAMLQEFGLERYCTTARSPLALAAHSVAATLDAADVAPEEIDTVVLATSSAGAFDHRALARWLSQLGLAHAYPLGVTFSYCGNIHAAFRVVSALMAAGQVRRVLVVCADRVAEGESRLVPPAISVSSDGAASCLISDRPSPGSYQLGATVQASNALLAPEDSEGRFLQYLQGLAGGIRGSYEQLLAGAGPVNVGTLIANNYNTWVNGNIVRTLKLPRRVLYADNIGRIAHVNTADNLINLRDWETSAAGRRDADVLMLGTGPNMWGLTLLRPDQGG
jgi:3-oxoacyl-[acyl-carrier-protein] synthase-3